MGRLSHAWALWGGAKGPRLQQRLTLPVTYFAFAKLSATCDQLTTFQNAPI